MSPDTSQNLPSPLRFALTLGITAVIVRMMRGRPIDYFHIAFLLELVSFTISLAKRNRS